MCLSSRKICSGKLEWLLLILILQENKLLSPNFGHLLENFLENTSSQILS